MHQLSKKILQTKNNGTIDIEFTRRRYDHTTYTWADVLIDGKWVSLGDPYPAINWPKTELEKEIERIISNESR